MRKKETFGDPVFDKKQVIKEILEKRESLCPGWKFFTISNRLEETLEFDKMNCDFLAIYTDLINKQITIKSNPFSEYKSTVEGAYQIVREVYITDQNINFFNNKYPDEFYKKIIAQSSKELFIKLKNEV